ncbi:hypothetical protein [Mycobacterium intracellulare]|uniref:hypothetical protein n=1 Tax=Mycobacterium intracellulare TaxID=1767 RepID=UPI001EEE9BF1|nr:hypothetical protein [Mycobacterium intracellulare]MEE3755248.1 hypothetical protein [Mycobacterium intracellulare]
MRTPHLLASCRATDPDAAYRHAELAIWDEFQGSLTEHPRIWMSLEEGVTVLREEVDEVWDEVRTDQIGRARAEAAQVGAMALRLVCDLHETGTSRQDRGRVAANEAHRALAIVGPQRRPLASLHEGHGYLQREFDALWSAVKCGEPTRELAIRVAATATRFIAEITSAPSSLAVALR